MFHYLLFEILKDFFFKFKDCTSFIQFDPAYLNCLEKKKFHLISHKHETPKHKIIKNFTIHNQEKGCQLDAAPPVNI